MNICRVLSNFSWCCSTYSPSPASFGQRSTRRTLPTPDTPKKQGTDQGRNGRQNNDRRGILTLRNEVTPAEAAPSQKSRYRPRVKAISATTATTTQPSPFRFRIKSPPTANNASQHLFYLVVVMTSPVLVTLGFVVLSLLPFGFGALSHADLHRAFEFSGKWR